MSNNWQTFTVPCGDHSFDFTLTVEEAHALRSRGINFIRSATCTTCGKVRSLDAREMLRIRAERESAVLPAATEAAHAEVLVAAGGNAKRVDEREVRRLAAVKAEAAVTALGKAELAPERAPEKATAAEWDGTTGERGAVERDVPPPLEPGPSEKLDSTGGKK